jgi:hypothetical protein
MKDYPRNFLPTLLGVFTAAGLTGLLLGPTTLVLRAEWALPWRLGGGGRLVTVLLHVAAAWLLIFLAGALWSLHMRRGWRGRRRRGSGASLASLLGVLALSALGVSYAGDDALTNAAAYLHLGAGLALLGLLLRHALRGRRLRPLTGGRTPMPMRVRMQRPSDERQQNCAVHRPQSAACIPGAPAEEASAGSASR